MKVLVRKVTDRKYWANDGTWTDDAASARVFDRSSAAVVACVKEDVKEVEIILIFSEKKPEYPQYDDTISPLEMDCFGMPA